MSNQPAFNQEANTCEAFEMQPRLVGEFLEDLPLKPEDWENCLQLLLTQ
jgi:hypothetical protein